MTTLYEHWPQILFWTLGGSTIVSSVAVVVTQNIVRCAMWLLLALGATAGLFFLLGADFVGAVQLLIYVGGTLVLVIFGVMLTAHGPFVRMQTRRVEWIIAAIVGASLFAILLLTIRSTAWPLLDISGKGDVNTAEAAEKSPTSMQLGLALLGIRSRDAQVQGEAAEAQPLGDPAGVGYLLPFEIVSVHLLVVLIGAAYLARAKRRRRPTQ